MISCVCSAQCTVCVCVCVCVCGCVCVCVCQVERVWTEILHPKPPASPLDWSRGKYWRWVAGCSTAELLNQVADFDEFAALGDAPNRPPPGNSATSANLRSDRGRRVSADARLRHRANARRPGRGRARAIVAALHAPARGYPFPDARHRRWATLRGPTGGSRWSPNSPVAGYLARVSVSRLRGVFWLVESLDPLFFEQISESSGQQLLRLFGAPGPLPDGFEAQANSAPAASDARSRTARAATSGLACRPRASPPLLVER
jgi:hypothetical protein